MARPRKKRPYHKNPNNPRWGGKGKQKEEKEQRNFFVLHAKHKRYTVVALLQGHDMRFGVAVTKRADHWSPADQYDGIIGEVLAKKRALSMFPDAVVRVHNNAKTIDLFRKNAGAVGAKVVSQIESQLKVKEELYASEMATFSREFLRAHPNFTHS